MTPMLQRIYSSEGGSELIDVLVKYLCVYSHTGTDAQAQSNRITITVTEDTNKGKLDTKAWLQAVYRMEVPGRHDSSHPRLQALAKSAADRGRRTSQQVQL
jgi:hypothetical protein